MIPQLDQVVTWVRVQKPVFDLVGVVLGALGAAAVCSVLALLLGCALGLGLIARNRRRDGRSTLTRLGLAQAPPR